MSNSEAEYCIDVIESFKALTNALEFLKIQLCEKDKSLPAWFQPPPNLPVNENASLREQAFVLISQLEYLSFQAPREILVGAGLIAASQQTVEAIEHLNDCKNAFKSTVLALKAAKVSTQHSMLSKSFEAFFSSRPTQLAQTLKRIGLSRIHLKQCYRRIPIFYTRPKKVSWTWANTRSIKRITVQEAEQLLNKHAQDPGIAQQLNKLRCLSFTEPLAIVQDLAPHLRANVVLPDAEGTTRQMVKGPVPIFYLDDSGTPLPDYHPPGEKRGKDRDRVVRRDVKLEPEPYLPAIRAHRYMA